MDRSPIVTTFRSPLGRDVKIVERGAGPAVVFLHSGVGSAGEWKQVFSLWPDGYRLIAIDAYGSGAGPGTVGRRSLDDYADQVLAVAQNAGVPIHLVGFSWGGATALRVATTAPGVLASLALIEPEAYMLLRSEDPDAYAVICGLRDSWRAHVRDGRWYEAFEEFIDFYNGPGSFARWPTPRRDAFLAAQRARGDLWDVLFDDVLTPDSLSDITAPVGVIEGSATSVVDRAICRVLRGRIQPAEHTLIEGAGHMMPLTHPELLTRALVNAIRE